MTENTAGRYQIEGPLGAGGMGVIYQAHDPSLDRHVALKFLSDASASDQTARLRLLREARTAATLNHPNILTIHEVGEADGRLFIAMELVHGDSLQHRIPSGGLAPALVIDYAMQIADALAHAHARGVVHRDLKSANVMVTQEGRIKVLDFGIARREAGAAAADDAGHHHDHAHDHSHADPHDLAPSAAHAADPPHDAPVFDATLTDAGLVLGTPHYLPPEVVQGHVADARSDLWSLGVLMYEMATGRMPFSGGSVQDLALSIASSDPDPVPASVPAGLRNIILRCLEKDPALRYQHASEVRSALEALRVSGGTSGAAFGSPARAGAKLAIWFVLAIVAVGIGAAFALRGLPGGGSASAGTIRSLAVLPLANLSGDPSQDYFADGMTEELITRLASIDSLKVISRTSVMQYRGSSKPIATIARELGVDGIVEGSVIRDGGRVRITAQLIDPARDQHLWADSYERDFMDVLRLQSEVAQDIAARVRLNLSAQQRERMAGERIRNPEAYEHYLRGRGAWSHATVAGMQQAISEFEQAIALDTLDARSYAGMSDAFLVLTQVLGALSFAEGLPHVRVNAEKALALDPTLAEANTSKAIAQIWVDRDWRGADRSLQRAKEINPNYAPAWVVRATLLNILGRLDESIAENRRGVELDPNSTIARYSLAWQLLSAKHYDEAMAEARAVLRMDPQHAAVQTLVCRIHELKGEYAKAVEASATDPGWTGSPPPTDALRRGFEAGGPQGYWQAYVGATLRTPTARRSRTWLAYAELQLGNRAEAIHWLRVALEGHEGDLLFLRASPLFESLRGDPGLDSVMVAVNLPPFGSAAGTARP